MGIWMVKAWKVWRVRIQDMVMNLMPLKQEMWSLELDLGGLASSSFPTFVYGLKPTRKVLNIGASGPVQVIS